MKIKLEIWLLFVLVVSAPDRLSSPPKQVPSVHRVLRRAWTKKNLYSLVSPHSNAVVPFPPKTTETEMKNAKFVITGPTHRTLDVST